MILFLMIITIGFAAISCGEQDCLNACDENLQICTQDCNNTHPDRAQDWEACNEVCQIDSVECRDICIPEYY